MTQVSIRTQIKKSITNGWLNNKKDVVTDSRLKQEIKDYTTVIIDGKNYQTISDGDRRDMFKDIRSAYPKNPRVQTYSNEIINIAMDSLNLPHSGYSQNHGTMGYVLTKTIGKDGIWAMFFPTSIYRGLPVNIVFAIDVPPDDPKKCIVKRNKLLKSFKDAKRFYAETVSDQFGINLDSAKDIVNSRPVKVLGFLNSYGDEAREAKSEFCIVDENGNPVKNPKPLLPPTVDEEDNTV